MLIYSIELPLPEHLTVRQILDLGCEWIYGSRHYRLQKHHFDEIWHSPESVVEAEGEKAEFGYVHLADSDFEIGGLKFTRKDEEGRQWVTTIVSSQSSGRHLVSVQLSCGLPDASMHLPKAKKPYFVKQLLANYGGGMDGEIPVSDKAIGLADGDEAIAAALIRGEGCNILPIVYVSCGFGEGGYAVDPKLLAQDLAGLAHVVVEPGRSFSVRLKQLTDARNVYGGSIGVYWARGSERKSYFLSEVLADERALKDKIREDIIRSLVNRRQTSICSWLHLKDSLSKQRLAQLKKNHYEAAGQDATVQEYIDAFDNELKIKEAHLAEANQEIARLEAEIRRLSASQFGRSGGILNTGVEQDLYDGEIRSFVLEALENQLERGAAAGSRQADILSDLIAANRMDEDLRLHKRNELKKLFNDYTHLTPKILNGLKRIGFAHSEDGKHHRFTFADDNRYQGTASKTSSDHRAGKNFARDLGNKVF
ncbi:hypothetical protein [Bergeriella denitrificans]|uniref:Uncharacterized protein n=1 Tax=Bergeriella denitrificans TaxID=494 RepID=A0A378UGN6_BERDE|nr:hypothetical protein [Bergeriella denitrificans]STZ75671.1 Uncharacterised protein [Bergeriella denitrificans]